jgi:phosphatidylglycerophosphate synthase
MINQPLEILAWSGLIALLLLLPRRRHLKPLGEIMIHDFRPFGPNWITVYGLIVTLTGFVLYVYRTSPVLGFVVVVGGAILDTIDGEMAKALGKCFGIPKPTGKCFFSAEMLRFRWREFNHGGPTILGAVFDPLADKVKALVIFSFFAYQGILSPWLVCLLAIPELVGTLIRPPFDLLKDYFDDVKASKIGKRKALLQWVTIIFCAPFHQRWIPSDHWAHNGLTWALNGLLGLTILLAMASVASRSKWIRQHKIVNEYVTPE